MEIDKNYSTNAKKVPTEVLITDALEVFNLLLKIGIKNGMTIQQISDKTGINQQSIYRYKSSFESQKKSKPSMSKVLDLADAVGYDLLLIKRENEDVEK